MKTTKIRSVLIFAALAIACGAPPLQAADSLGAITQYGFLTVGGYPFSVSPNAKKAIAEQQAPKQGNAETWSDIWKNMLTSFAMPFEDLKKKKSILDGLSARVVLNIPFKARDTASGGETIGERLVSTSLNASLTYTPFGFWFVGVSFMKYLNPYIRQPWEPDFAYRFGYDDWHPYTFSFVYSNYGANRFDNPERGKSVTYFERGSWSFGFKLPTANFLSNLLSFHESSGLAHSFGFQLSPQYEDGKTGQTRLWKTALTMNNRYTIFQSFYVNLVLFYYPIADQQQDWDPDYTYGFGYQDWRSNTISIQYNNYSGNRYPWRPQPRNTGLFADGSLTVSWSYSF